MDYDLEMSLIDLKISLIEIAKEQDEERLILIEKLGREPTREELLGEVTPELSEDEDERFQTEP